MDPLLTRIDSLFGTANNSLPSKLCGQLAFCSCNSPSIKEGIISCLLIYQIHGGRGTSSLFIEHKGPIAGYSSLRNPVNVSSPLQQKASKTSQVSRESSNQSPARIQWRVTQYVKDAVFLQLRVKEATRRCLSPTLLLNFRPAQTLG